jgi:ABC-type nitrate/sulfonate/bicarbonate transport system ATPase subunit
MNPWLLEFDDVHYTWNAGTPEAVEVLQGMSFSIRKGEYAAILGPSGCGKSTSMQLAAALEFADAGEIRWKGRPIEGPSPERGLISQKPKLFPWCTALSATEWGLRMRGMPRRQRRQIAMQMLAEVGLSAHARQRVSELSGGMQQRVAIAQVLANNCQLILMDEPYAGLDVQTSVLMQQFFLDFWKKTGKTILMVTHDVDEALMADRVIVYSRRPAKVLLDQRLDGGELDRPRDVRSFDYVWHRGRFIEYIRREVMAIAEETGDWQSAAKAPPIWVGANDGGDAAT